MSEEKTCFIIAPIGEPDSETRKRSDQILKHVITPAVEECGYNPIRADHISEPGIITTQVIQHIVEDPLVIADLTDQNPNVFYELAIRHAVKKPLVQIIQTGEQIPFDVAATRAIFVDHRDLDSVEKAKLEIVKQIKAAEEDPSKIDTPISLALDLQLLRQKVATLKKKSERISVTEFAKEASEICILVVTGASVITDNIGFHKTKLREGCNIRAILLDPKEKRSLQTWERLKGRSVTKRLETSLHELEYLRLLPEAKGKCDFRVSKVFLPFSICAADLNKESGSMNVEYHSYKFDIDKRPHVHLTASDSPYWFEYYRQQFEQFWKDAREWP